MKRKSISQLTGIVILYLATGLLECPVRAEQSAPVVMEAEALQHMLCIPNKTWTPELKSLAVLLEQKRYSEADALLDNWLQSDFTTACLTLPALKHFNSYYNHSIAPIFAKHIARKFPGAKGLECLAMMNLGNPAVRKVGVCFMADWWVHDRTAMAKWIKETPCFFGEIYYEDFLKTVLPTEQNPGSLACLFLSLKQNDYRRARFFGQIIESWVETDIDRAIHFVLQQIKANHGAEDVALDRAALELSYRYANQHNFAESLMWAARIRNADMRELGVRDHSLSVSEPSDKQLFRDWLTTYPFIHMELYQEILEHLNSSTSGQETGI